MLIKRNLSILLLVLLAGASSSVLSESTQHHAAQHAEGHVHEVGADFDEAEALEFSQAAIGRRVGNYQLSGVNGESVHLDDLLRRPLVISLIYTSCYHTCPTITSHVANAVEVAQDALGEESFSVLTIGFDVAVDSPDRMRIFAAERGIDNPKWRFLSIDAGSLEKLVHDLGFIYFRSPKGFDHLAQTTVVDADGKVYQQVYGDSFPAPALVEPLKQLVFGTRADITSLDGWINSVKLFCTIYDPTSGKYHFDYSVFVGIIAGLLSLGAIAVFLLRAWRQSGTPA